MTIREKWICRCGIKRKISLTNIKKKKFKKCPYCKDFPSNKNIEEATKKKVMRYLKFFV